jgi:hypothetical protein
MTTPAVPSSNFEVVRENMLTLDKFVNNPEGSILTRAGETLTVLPQLVKNIEGLGWDYLDPATFETGATITTNNQALRHAATGEYYRWVGVVPKTVAAGVLPSSDVLFKAVGSGALRNELASVNSTVMVGGVEAGGIAKRISGYVTPEEFDAIGDGVADDTTPVFNWLTALAANTRLTGLANKNYALNVVSLATANGLKIVGTGTFKALGVSRLYMIHLVNVQGLVAVDGVTIDGSSIVARPFEIANVGNATAGNVYIGQGCRFINAKNVAPRTDNAGGVRVVGNFDDVVFEGEVDGVDNNLTADGVSVGAWFDWSGTSFIKRVLVTSKARIKNVKNDNSVTADCDGIQRMGPTTEHLFFTVEEGAYFENCKGRSIKSQVVQNTISAPIIVRNAYDGLIEIDLQYGGGCVSGARILYNGRRVNAVIGSTSRLNLPSECTMRDNILTIKNPPVTNTGIMCSFSSSDNTDTVTQEGLLCHGNKVFGGSVDNMVSIRCGNVIDSNRIVIRDNWADGIGISYINMFEMFNNPPQLSIVFEGNGSKTQCASATLTVSSRLRVESDKNNSKIAPLPVWAETITSGALTLYGGNAITVDTEGGASTDDVVTITGGNYATDDIVVFRSASNSRVPTFKNGTGNIFLAGSDFALDNVRDRLTLSYDASSNAWCEVSRSNNGA